MKKSVVLELQQEILSTNCDILSALRKAHVIARKLNLVEFDNWIQGELQGYKKHSEIPDYRSVHGSLQAWNPYRGWIPTMIHSSEMEQTICNQKLGNSLSSLIELYNKNSTGSFEIQFNGEILSALNEMFDVPIEMKFVLKVGAHQLKGIIEHIKDYLLQWTMDLEQAGIMGEGLSFTSEEKSAAQTLSGTINNYYGTTSVINAPVNNSPIVNGNSNTANFNYNDVERIMAELSDALKKEDVSAEDRETITELVEELNDKIKTKKKPGIIKSALIGLKDFLISAGASVAAALIQSNISIFG